ncbi:hypothetical protein [Azospirillum sp. ST 5-10]|uniref:hypothetical protein n=1 Tax=unclassified Azospirillum TaxID=2630922 RepID=UPI003F4A8059
MAAMMLPTLPVRRVLEKLTPNLVQAQEDLNPPPPPKVFLPPGHRNAFDWNSSIVVGMRGAGKSLWTAALTDDTLRQIMAREWRIDLLKDLEVHVAFGQAQWNEQFPSPDTLTHLVADFEPRLIWKTVAVKRAIANQESAFAGLDDWQGRVAWVSCHPEKSDRLLLGLERELTEGGRRLIFVFDALDRLSSDWGVMRSLVKGALQFALSLRMTTGMRAKLFLRPDMVDDAEIWTFPDSSKLRQSQAGLNWSFLDLYGLIIQYTINDDEHGSEIRSSISQFVEDGRERGYVIARDWRNEDAFIRRVVEAMAGPYMGRDPRRGRTFTWIPNHLADAEGQVSPRTMLLAFGESAIQTDRKFPDHPLALHFRAINDGVTRSSRTRVNELREDYPWVQPLLEALRGLTVPCNPELLFERWDAATIDSMASGGKLPPKKFTTDPVRRGKVEVLIEDLEDLAVLSRAEGGRINFPDIFRVAAGMKRKGGVPAAR